ncbi:MAG: SAM-dependent chlorinase/fluorinase [Spirochaetales bacterium]|nr:SAM-dependent chlorinase/fluorinase [Spirochaetales bacterium]
MIALLTDFGLRDSYVGVMKGVMLNSYPEVSFIDISHSIEPFNIISASYLLYSAWDYFPKGTVFLSVVDPGVGTERNILLYLYNNNILITPDNGTISVLKRMHPASRTLIVSNQTIEKKRIGMSDTFHGRDIFAPLAADIAKNGLASIQAREEEGVVLKKVWPEIDKEKAKVSGSFIHIDHFGNCVSSIHASDLAGIQINAPASIHIGETRIHGVKRCFSDAAPGEFLVYEGSSGFLEVAVREGNAAENLHITDETRICIQYQC